MKFCANLKQHATEIISCQKKETPPLTTKEKKLYKKQIFCQICKEEFDEEFNEDENYHKFTAFTQENKEALRIVSVS